MFVNIFMQFILLAYKGYLEAAAGGERGLNFKLDASYHFNIYLG